ncbi:MAG: hypothetical protein HYS07_05295 [Chlamydiae bacterium]|nr:hypothetical protein [Chlamydiota bacterium]MBI3278002.1 hypothetical protein [Chlamydiota bacterium]
MKKFLFLTIILLDCSIHNFIFAQYAGPPNFGTNLSSGLTYTHPQGIFTLQFPQGWIQTQLTDLRQAAYFIDVQGGVILAEAAIYLETIPQTVTPQVYAIAVEQNTLRNTLNYQRGLENTLTLNGQIVAHRQFTYGVNLQGQMKTVWAEHYYFVSGNISGNMGIVLHFATYPQTAAQLKLQLDEIVKSFRVFGPNTTQNFQPSQGQVQAPVMPHFMLNQPTALGTQLLPQTSSPLSNSMPSKPGGNNDGNSKIKDQKSK